MSRKDFEALADALALVRPGPNAIPGSMDTWRSAVLAVAHVCARHNQLFDRARFVSACETRPNGAGLGA